MTGHARTIRLTVWWVAAVLVIGAASAGRAKGAGPTDLHGDVLPPGAVARLGSVRFRFDQPGITAVAYWPNGKGLLATNGQTVRAFDADTGRRLWRMDSRIRLTGVGVTADKDLVLSADSGTAVFLYLHPLLGQASKPYGIFRKGTGFRRVVFSGKGRRFALFGGLRQIDVWEFSSARTISEWDPAAAEKKATLSDPPEPVSSVALSGDGRRAVAAGGGRVAVWDTDTGRVLARITRPEKVTALAISPDGRRVAIVTGGNYLVSWQWKGKAVPRPLARVAKGEITLPVFSPEGSRLAYRCGDVYVIDAAGGLEVWRLKLAGGSYRGALTFSPRGDRLAWAGDHVHVWSMTTGRRIGPEVEPVRRVKYVTFSADGSAVATYLPGRVVLWKSATGERIRAIDLPKGAMPEGEVALSGADGLLAVPVAGSLVLRAARTGVRVRQTAAQEGCRLDRVTFSPDASLVAAVWEWPDESGQRAQRSLHVWRVEDGRQIAALALGRQELARPVFSRDGKRLAIGARQVVGRCSIQWYDLASARLGGIVGCDSLPAAMVFDRGGRRLGCLHTDGSVSLVDLASQVRRKIPNVLAAPGTAGTEAVREAAGDPIAGRLSAACSADGRHLLVADGLHGLAWLEWPTGKVVARRTPQWRLGRSQVPPAGSAHVTAVSPDGRYIAWPTANGTVLIYDGHVPPEQPTTRPATKP